MNKEIEKQKLNDIFKEHKVEINGVTYKTKLDKVTNRSVYKRQFSVSINGIPKRMTTRVWQTSVTKVNAEVEQMRSDLRSGNITTKKKANKHLYEDIVEDYYTKRVQLCIAQQESFDTVEKYYSNNLKYALNEKMPYQTFCKKNIEDLTIADIKNIKHAINTYALERELSKITVSAIFSNIDRTLRYASELMYIDDTISNSVKITPKGVASKKQITLDNYLMKSEFDELMLNLNKVEFLKKESTEEREYRYKLYKTFLDCAFKLGFRRGEGFALFWGNIKGDRISIELTLNTKYVKKHTGISYRRINPKNKVSIRTMKMPGSIKTCLEEWKKYCQKLGYDTSDTSPIFLEYNNDIFKPTTFANRLIVIMNQTGIEKKYNKHIYPHTFRHSCCSYLIQSLREADNEISLREIQIQVGRYLGHADDQMVRQVYGHLYPDKEESLMNMMLEKL